ncbi:SRPBCC domain-containing protein [Methylobacterium nodulans]|uniref:Carbon monoxide dehydrogenase subunit G n=1 Tax=Methylobacterium nodulans (strain LMG 21967 / CNCM I-2342 / ORS 2060) TaxID=460265 RepID=B8ITC8_METNO|nr:carbon monoxide dehydrogenase subunit G [Methylobacterium nodulans ORS 2060]
MDITGEYRVAAPRAVVWTALNNSELLARCIPGCKELTQASPAELGARPSNGLMRWD